MSDFKKKTKDFVFILSRMVGKDYEEKHFVNYDELDEAAEDGQGRSRTVVDAICHKCYLLPCAKCSCRYTIALLRSMGFMISFGIRCNMGVAILQMTSNRTEDTGAQIVSTVFVNHIVCRFKCDKV